jgi:hypothetical protein
MKATRLRNQILAARNDVKSYAKKLSRLRYEPSPAQIERLKKLNAEITRQGQALEDHMSECETCIEVPS